MDIEKRFLFFCEYLEMLKSLSTEEDFKYLLKLFEMELKFYD